MTANRREGLHTLCLLDIRVREPTEQSLARGRPIYEPPRYMSANLAAQQLLEVEAKRQEKGSPLSRHMLCGTLTFAPSCAAYSPSTLCVGRAALQVPLRLSWVMLVMLPVVAEPPVGVQV